MKGKIYSWNDEKGFAFIEIENSKRRVFAHISEFVQRNPKPKVGEEVSFDLVSHSTQKNKFAARNIRYTQRVNKRAKKQNITKSHTNTKKHHTPSFVNWLIGIAVISILFAIGAKMYNQIMVIITPKQENIPIATPIHVEETQPQVPQPTTQTPPIKNRVQVIEPKQKYVQLKQAKPQETSTNSIYRCDGRTLCSQMTSCEEAKFFLRNCQNTKMDGDWDGIPCEGQWCTY